MEMKYTNCHHELERESIKTLPYNEVKFKQMINTHYRAKSNGLWVFGDLYNNCDRGVNQNFIVRDNEELGTGDHILVDSYTTGISICTMVSDRAGNLIYEGDFLKDEEMDEEGNRIVGYYPVVYNKDTGCWCIDNSYYKNNSHLVPMIDYFGSDMQVDGNIFDNPDRLPKINYDDNKSPSDGLPF